MGKVVTAAEANRNFSTLLRAVAAGETVTVTSHGRPVADIVPRKAEVDKEKRRRDFRAFLDQMAARPVQNIGPWSRDELYER